MPKSRRNHTQRRAPMGTAANTRPREERGRTSSAETPLAIISPDLRLTPAFREHVRSRAGFQLGKMAERIDRVSVRLHRISGPTGAPRYRCRVKLVLPAARSIVVEAVERAPEEAFNRAMDVAERAVRRTLTRRRERARRTRSG